MAFYRQLLVFTVPSVAVLFGIYWYRRRRGFGNCDPGGSTRNTKTLKQELEEAVLQADTKSLNRKISAPTKIIVKSAPIDIVPNGIHSLRSSPIELSDKEIDLEIEKVRSQKQEMELSYRKNSKENTPPTVVQLQTPVKTTSHVSSKPQCDIDKSVTSCLTTQLSQNSLKDDMMTKSSINTNTTAPKSTICPTEQIISKKIDADLAAAVPECKRLSNDRIIESDVDISVKVDCESARTHPPQDAVVVVAASVETNASNDKNCSVIKNDKDKKNSRKSRKQDKKLNISIDKKSTEKKQQPVCSESSSTQCDTLNAETNSNNLTVVADDEAISAAVASVNLSTSTPSDNDVPLSRDSANHSPCDTMLTSPSIGHFSDNHSEGSNDSGKGCSESPSPPPTSAGDISTPSNYLCHQFFLPKSVTGILIGTKKFFLNKLNTATKANVYLKEHEDDTSKYNICVIEGTQQDIDITLELIRQRIPEKRFPNVSLKDVTAELLQSDYTQLAHRYNMNLVEGVNNDVIISCYVTPIRLFLQQPTHPTYPSLHILHNFMGTIYQDPLVPSLPAEVTAGMICAAPTANNWYRAVIMTTNKDNDTSYVKLVDFGGFMEISNSLLKQVRRDFMLLPFQAIEVELAGLAPAGSEWAPEAIQIVAGLTTGQLLQAQIVGYNDDDVPLVHLYLTLGPQQVISLNQELVTRGLAVWIE